MRTLGTEYQALAVWTGVLVEDVRRQVEVDHEGPREHWVAWREGEVVGAVHPVLTLTANCAVLAARGDSLAIAEVGETNTASRTLFGRFGAIQTGLEVELTRS